MSNSEKIRKLLNIMESQQVDVVESYDDDEEPEERYDRMVRNAKSQINSLIRILPEIFDGEALAVNQERLRALFKDMG